MRPYTTDPKAALTAKAVAAPPYDDEAFPRATWLGPSPESNGDGRAAISMDDSPRTSSPPAGGISAYMASSLAALRVSTGAARGGAGGGTESTPQEHEISITTHSTKLATYEYANSLLNSAGPLSITPLGTSVTLEKGTIPLEGVIYLAINNLETDKVSFTRLMGCLGIIDFEAPHDDSEFYSILEPLLNLMKALELPPLPESLADELERPHSESHFLVLPNESNTIVLTVDSLNENELFPLLIQRVKNNYAVIQEILLNYYLELSREYGESPTLDAITEKFDHLRKILEQLEQQALGYLASFEKVFIEQRKKEIELLEAEALKRRLAVFAERKAVESAAASALSSAVKSGSLSGLTTLSPAGVARPVTTLTTDSGAVGGAGALPEQPATRFSERSPALSIFSRAQPNPRLSDEKEASSLAKRRAAAAELSRKQTTEAQQLARLSKAEIKEKTTKLIAERIIFNGDFFILVRPKLPACFDFISLFSTIGLYAPISRTEGVEISLEALKPLHQLDNLIIDLNKEYGETFPSIKDPESFPDAFFESVNSIFAAYGDGLRLKDGSIVYPGRSDQTKEEFDCFYFTAHKSNIKELYYLVRQQVTDVYKKLWQAWKNGYENAVKEITEDTPAAKRNETIKNYRTTVNQKLQTLDIVFSKLMMALDDYETAAFDYYDLIKSLAVDERKERNSELVARMKSGEHTGAVKALAALSHRR